MPMEGCAATSVCSLSFTSSTQPSNTVSCSQRCAIANTSSNSVLGTRRLVSVAAIEAFEEEEEGLDEAVGEVEGTDDPVGVEGFDPGAGELLISPRAAVRAAKAAPSMTKPATVVTGRRGAFALGTTAAAAAAGASAVAGAGVAAVEAAATAPSVAGPSAAGAGVGAAVVSVVTGVADCGLVEGAATAADLAA